MNKLKTLSAETTHHFLLPPSEDEKMNSKLKFALSGLSRQKQRPLGDCFYSRANGELQNNEILSLILSQPKVTNGR